VTTVRIADPGSLVAALAPRHPLAFIRDGDGIVGFGEALRLEFSGPSRFTDAAAAWRALVAASAIDDSVHCAGTGLVALGSFAFADGSHATSVLIVPSVILGRRGGDSWVTSIASAARPAPSPFTSAASVGLTPGRMSPKEYAASVSSAVARIAAGEASKVVLARDLTGAIPTDYDLRVPIARLSAAYPDTFTFAVDGLVGSSPETLVRVEGNAVTARVLAGTAPRGDDAVTDAAARDRIEASEKDLAEHAFALSSVMSALDGHASGVSSSPRPFPLALPNLWHLASDVTGTLTDGSSSLDLIAALHPTAAVAGAPTPAALRIIAELEPFDRGRYSGPVGWVGANGDGEWAVALRCAHIEGTTVTAFAGAGIVADSDPARELAETTLKFRPITEAFG
jgi:menaquinone-specific isochorismate synthase